MRVPVLRFHEKKKKRGKGKKDGLGEGCSVS